jgi:hypothetical protein
MNPIERAMLLTMIVTTIGIILMLMTHLLGACV